MDWIILGTGGVARKFALDLRSCGHRVVAVASRNPEKARAFVATLGLSATAGGYEEILDGTGAKAPGQKAAYIATPPGAHEALALAAISRGLPVLVEKPFAADAAAGERIVTAARMAGVFAMEAMWTRFQPLIETTQAAIAAGRLGEIRGFDARFLIANRPDPEAGLFDRTEGGALLHRGVYALSLARHLLGPVTEMATLGRLAQSGADEDSALILRHDTGALSTLRASLRAGGGPEASVIWGSTGTLTLEGPVYRPVAGRITPVHPIAATGGGAARRLEAFRESAQGLRLSRALSSVRAKRAEQRLSGALVGNGYHHQAVAVAAALAHGKTEEPRMPLDESLEILGLIDQAKAIWAPTT